MKKNIATKLTLSGEEKVKRLRDAVKSTEYLRQFLRDDDEERRLFTVTKIAKDYGITAVLLNKLLTELHVQYRGGENPRNVFVEQRFLSAGYAEQRLYEFQHNTDSREDRHVWAKWTMVGRVFLFFVLRECCGLLPVAETPAVPGKKKNKLNYNFKNNANI